MADKKKNRSSSKQARDGIRRAGSAEVYGVRTAGDATLAKLLAEALVASGPVDRATHGFHTYPAGLHPDAAKLVIEACPGAVHDPFCGGGTVLIEAVLAGRATSGTRSRSCPRRRRPSPRSARAPRPPRPPLTLPPRSG